MVERSREKAKRAGAPQGAGGEGAQALVARITALEAERDGLKRDLEAARARIAAMEEARSEVANRIDGVIAALGSIPET